MQIVIDIPEDEYEAICYNVLNGREHSYGYVAIANGTPLPKGHGRLGDLDALYQEIETRGWFDSDDEYYGGGLEDIVLSASTLIESDKEVDE